MLLRQPQDYVSRPKVFGVQFAELENVYKYTVQSINTLGLWLQKIEISQTTFIYIIYSK